MEDEAENPEAQEAPESEEASASSGGSGSIKWLAVLVGAAVIGSAGGFAMARLVGGGGTPAKAEAATDQKPEAPAAPPGAVGDLAYYHFEPFTVNLAGDNMNRYIRATITLAIEAKSYKEANKRIEIKKPELTNWMTVFLADCTLERVRGAKALNRLRREIKDSFNEQLWPDQPPLVQDVLFKEFFVQ